jgi:tetratricopeptide (TPR) repeat protein
MANETKPKTRKQVVEDARQAALAGEWNHAIELNKQLLERTPRDAEAYNRIGRAHLEMREYAEAIEAYTQALKMDKANIIARRNLQRLELLRKSGENEHTTGATAPRTAVFIEEVGRTWVDELVNPLDLERLALISPSEQLQLENADGVLYVTTVDGERLGEVEEKTAERIIQLLQNGNLYEVYALGISSRSLRVILREVYRDPRNANLVSFPRQISATRAYLRERDSLRARDESEFIMLDDDDDNDDDSAADTSDDDDSSDRDGDGFIDDSLQIEEDDAGI